jgi:response regulator RpfG family c-di-GMP phosphodiesterase
MSESSALRGVSVVELASLIRAAAHSVRPELIEAGVGLTFMPRDRPLDITPGAIPAEWLHWIDDRSIAGAGHGQRVASVCLALAACLPDSELDLEELQVAANVHEIGSMSGHVSDPVELAHRGADLAADLGYSQRVVRAIRHMHERWDGSARADRAAHDSAPLSSSVLSIADSIDHSAAAWMEAGVAPRDAVDRVVGQVVTQQATKFIPSVVGAVAQASAVIRATCGVPRTRLMTGISSAGRRVYTTIAMTLLGRLS